MESDVGVDQATFTFHEQADGRKVARLPSGKIVLIHYDSVSKVKNGEQWLVQLEHHPLYAVATPLERLAKAPQEAAPVLKPKPTTTVVLASKATPASPAVVPVAVAKPVPTSAVATPSLFVQPQDRVAIFVDGANMDGACRDAGYYLDYFKVGDFLRGKGAFRAAFYYVADFTARDPMQLRFLDFLAHSGYIVRKKPVKVIRDKDTGQETYKANVDTEMVLDMVNTADNYDVAFLLSGDSDFERCVDLLRSRGKRVYVMTSERTLSRELSHVADKPIFFIEDYKDRLAREDRAPTQGSPVLTETSIKPV